MILAVVGVIGLTGCGDKEITYAGKEQPPNQKPMVGQDRIDNLTRMLGRDDASLVIGACQQLAASAPEAKSALPTLEKLVAEPSNAEVKQAAAAAVKAIKSGVAVPLPGTEPAE